MAKADFDALNRVWKHAHLACAKKLQIFSACVVSRGQNTQGRWPTVKGDRIRHPYGLPWAPSDIAMSPIFRMLVTLNRYASLASVCAQSVLVEQFRFAVKFNVKHSMHRTARAKATAALTCSRLPA